VIRLALDTSTRLASVAVGRDDEVLTESQLAARVTHSESVLPEIDRQLSVCGLSPADVDEVIVGAGPGSFTGVRIAASFAKGMCFASGSALYAYSSLAAVAAGAGLDGPVCALFDARRGQVYAAGYRVGEGLEELLSPEAVVLGLLLERLDAADWVFAGDGAGPGRGRIEAAGGRILGEDLWFPRASALLRLRRVAAAAGRVSDVRSWEPAYLRLPAAQRELED